MKKKNFLVKRLARNVQVMNQDSAHRQLDGVSFRGFHPGCVLHLDRHRARHPETRV